MTQKKKTRDTSFSKSWQLIDKHGMGTIKKTWQKHGMYKTAELLKTSPWVIRYIIIKEGFTRKAEKVPHLVKAVQNGHAKTSDYKSLDFTNVQINSNKTNGEQND